MINEILEFKSYVTTSTSDTPRLQPKMLTDDFGSTGNLYGLGHILTIIARGFIFGNFYEADKISDDGMISDNLITTVENILFNWLGFECAKDYVGDVDAINKWNDKYPQAAGWLKDYYKNHFTKATVYINNVKVKKTTDTEDVNYISDADFSKLEKLDGSANWHFLETQNGKGTVTISKKKLAITAKDEEGYSIQLVQSGILMEKGATYEVTFDASADKARTLEVNISGSDKNHMRYFRDTTGKLTNKKNTYKYIFTMNEDTDANSRLEFNMGSQGSKKEMESCWAKIEKKWTESLQGFDYRLSVVSINNIIAGAIEQGPLKEQCMVIKKDSITTKSSKLKERFQYLFCLDESKKAANPQEKTVERFLKNIAAYLYFKDNHPQGQKFVLLDRIQLLCWYGLDDNKNEADSWYFKRFLFDKGDSKEPIMTAMSSDRGWNFIKLMLDNDFIAKYDISLIDVTAIESIDRDKYWIIKDNGHGVGSICWVE